VAGQKIAGVDGIAFSGTPNPLLHAVAARQRGGISVYNRLDVFLDIAPLKILASNQAV
jgi:hypothetical protein